MSVTLVEVLIPAPKAPGDLADGSGDELGVALAAERLENAARINGYRLSGISAFFFLFVVLGSVLDLKAWQGNLQYFGPYWLATLVVFLASRRFVQVRRLAGLAIAVVDVPMIFLLQLATFPTSPSAAAVAGFNLGIYVMLVILSALSLDGRIIAATALASAIFEAALQHLAGVSAGAIVSTFVIMGIAGFSCSYGSRRLVRLLRRVVADMGERQRVELALDRAREELHLAKREMDIARQIQTAILPRELAVPGFELAGEMRTAEDVGGDYYDVRPATNGCWIGIGDVSGHGLDAGLVMMMIQVAVASLVADGARDVAEVVTALNRVIYENVHDRMQLSKHATFSILRFYVDGRVAIAGAHEEIFIFRHATGTCDRIPTTGAWLGILPDVGHCSSTSWARLDRGDVMLLHTDGITEAMTAGGELFGKERLVRLLTDRGDLPVAELCHLVVEDALRFGAKQDDDATVVVIRKT